MRRSETAATIDAPELFFVTQQEESGSVEASVRAWLRRIAAHEPDIRAWHVVDRAGALARARALDQLPAATRGPLHGWTLGVKDLIDTADLPTAYGSPIYAGHQPAADAAVVALAWAAGAVVLGKTVTTEFAAFHPGKTRNPRNPAHTPGGSSSGSAAAVADGTVRAALGTQTAGSIIRPATYCGVVGYKPSFGLLPRAGVKPLAESLDTVGVLTSSVRDAAQLVSALAARPELTLAREPAAARLRPPRLGLCRTWEWSAATPDTVVLFEMLGETLARVGAAADVELPESFRPLAETQGAVMAHEAARNLASERLTHSARLSPRMRAWLAEGDRVAPARYDVALALARSARREFVEFFAATGCDALLAPSAPGGAPAGLAETGDPIFNRVWTLLHAPCVHVPLARGLRGLPLGVTVVAPRGNAAAALRAAHGLERPVLAAFSPPAPP